MTHGQDTKHIARDAYFAGIVDGEGALTISRSWGKENRSRVYQAFCRISNTEPGLIKWLADSFGGKIHTYSPKQTPKNSRKLVYYWQVSGKNLDSCLSLISPYSIIKLEQIDVLKTMRETYNKKSPGYNGVYRLSDDVIAIREDCYQRLKLLHNRTYSRFTASLGLP